MSKIGKGFKGFLQDFITYGGLLGVALLILAFCAWALRLSFSLIFGG